MAYLLSQYTLLFLLTALLAFFLGRWWAQRRFVDVTESWETLRRSREQEEGFRNRLWTGLEELRRSVAPTVRTELAALPVPEKPELDLSEVLAALKTLERRIDSLPKPPAFDLEPALNRFSALERRIDSLPEPQRTDLGPLESKVKELEQAILALPVPKPLDPAPLLERLDRLERSFEALPVPEAPDLSPTNDRIESLERALMALPVPQAPDFSPISARIDSLAQDLKADGSSNPVDLSVVTDRLAGLDARIKDLPVVDRQDLQSINARLAELERAQRDQVDGRVLMERWARIEARLGDRGSRTDADLSGVQATLKGFEARVRRQLDAQRDLLPRLERQDLQSINFRLGELERMLRQPLATDRDLPRLLQRFSELESVIAGLACNGATKVFEGAEAFSLSAPAVDGPELFDAPERGEPDDLKRISGVGPKLEGLLHRNGVYYFWQVASWTPANVQFIDDRLEVFKGRIERDDWVRQAQQLMQEPGAAKP